MDDKIFRKLVIALMDDDEDINEKAYDILYHEMVQRNDKKPGTFDDILRAVDAVDGRFYLP